MTVDENVDPQQAVFLVTLANHGPLEPFPDEHAGPHLDPLLLVNVAGGDSDDPLAFLYGNAALAIDTGDVFSQIVPLTPLLSLLAIYRPKSRDGRDVARGAPRVRADAAVHEGLDEGDTTPDSNGDSLNDSMRLMYFRSLRWL